MSRKSHVTVSSSRTHRSWGRCFRDEEGADLPAEAGFSDYPGVREDNSTGTRGREGEKGPGGLQVLLTPGGGLVPTAFTVSTLAFLPFPAGEVRGSERTHPCVEPQVNWTEDWLDLLCHPGACHWVRGLHRWLRCVSADPNSRPVRYRQAGDFQPYFPEPWNWEEASEEQREDEGKLLGLQLGAKLSCRFTVISPSH